MENSSKSITNLLDKEAAINFLQRGTEKFIKKPHFSYQINYLDFFKGVE